MTQKTRFCKFLYSDYTCDSETCDFAHSVDELNIRFCYNETTCKNYNCKYIHKFETKQMWINRIGIFLLNSINLDINNLLHKVSKNSKICHSIMLNKKYCNYNNCQLAHSFKDLEVENCNTCLKKCDRTCIKLHFDESFENYLKRLNLDKFTKRYSICENERNEIVVKVKPKFVCDVLALSIQQNAYNTKIHIC